MATYYADIQTNINTKMSGSRNRAGRLHGRIRTMVSAYTVPTATLAIADVLQWGTLPKGARVIPNMCKLYWSTGTASSTVNVGDSSSAVRHLASTSVATAGSATCEASGASGAIYETTAETVIQSVVAGAVLAAGQVLTLHIAYVVD